MSINIEKNYPKIKKAFLNKGNIYEQKIYKLEDSIKAEDNVFIEFDAPLYVSGSIECDSIISKCHLYAASISTKGNIDALGIFVENDIISNGYIETKEFLCSNNGDILSGSHIYSLSYISAPNGIVECPGEIKFKEYIVTKDTNKLSA